MEVEIDERLADRRGTAGQTRPTAAGHDRKAVSGGHPHARLDVGGAPWERHQPRTALDHRSIARVQPQGEGVVQDAVLAERLLEFPVRGGEVAHDRRLRPRMAIWAELERDDPEPAAFGRERIEGHVCFHATLRADGSPRVHPVSPWFGAGLLVVGFRARSPKVDEIGRDARYALHTPMDNHEGEGGEFMVRGLVERLADDHPAARARPYTAEYAIAVYAMSVEEAIGTTYEMGPPTYHRWTSPEQR